MLIETLTIRSRLDKIPTKDACLVLKVNRRAYLRRDT